MKVKSEPESVECCACDELNDEPLDLSIPGAQCKFDTFFQLFPTFYL